MTQLDPRLTPCNARIADHNLKEVCDAPRYVVPKDAAVIAPVADLFDEPHGKRIRQVLFGTELAFYEEFEGHAYIQSKRDGYVGYIDKTHLILTAPISPDVTAYKVSAPQTHLYAAPDIKGPALMVLPFGAVGLARPHDDRFLAFELGEVKGFVIARHVKPQKNHSETPIEIAKLFLNCPYLWGGNSFWGIDCSGLVQTAWQACGIPCPADSDMQARDFGRALETGEDVQGGDLIFWPGHVGMMVDEQHLIHANAHHMATVIEPLERVEARILAEEAHHITQRRRYEKPHNKDA